MINRPVAERLIENLTGVAPIKHQQGHWLGGSSSGTDLFVISEDGKWSCATSGCAAGHIFIDEADPGMTFHAGTQKVYPDKESARNRVAGMKIEKWAGQKLGIDHDQQQFLFYSFGDTKDIVNRIRFLLKYPDSYDLDLYNEGTKY